MPDSLTLNFAELEGGLRGVSLGGQDLVLARVGEEVFALGGKCPHLGGPLAQGVLSGERLMCPWHHACFDLRKGTLLEPPALNAPKRYKVERHGDEVTVTLEELPPLPQPPARPDGRTFVLLGGGAAGELCAQTLREEGFGGRIVMLSAQEHAPYDRTKLSKAYLAGKAKADALPLRGEDWYAAHGIEVRLNTVAEKVNPEKCELYLRGGETLGCDALFIATGGAPNTLQVPGANLGNVRLLRRESDADGILSALPRVRNVVIVGSSFIGMEAASSLIGREELSVTVVGQEGAPFEKTLGPDVGGYFRTLHEGRGVQFRMNAQVERFEGRFEGDGNVQAVVLKGGERLPADLVLLGIGVRPATDILPKSLLADKGAVPVDAQLRAAPNVFSGGDIAQFPYRHGPSAQTGEPIRVEHWRVAQQHGRTAAKNMLGQSQPYEGVPFFWTQQYGLSLRYVGHAEKWDETVTWGDVAKGEFVVFYVRGGEVRAAAGLKRDNDLAALEELMRLGRVPSPAELRGGEFKLADRL